MEEILRKLVAFHTVDGDEPAAHQSLDYIADFVTQRGMHVARFDSNGYESIVATMRAGYKTPKVMLVAHIDVVPAPDASFKLRQDDDKFYGRGVLDMKCAIAAYLQIIDELQGSLATYDFGLMITTDEEKGGLDGVGALVAEGYKPEVCILPDGGDNWQIQLFSKGFLYIAVTTEGKPAHGSRPWLGDNAILPLIKILQDIQALFPSPGITTNTCSVGMISGGEASNQVAARAIAKLDIRVTSDTEKAPILQSIKQICAEHNASYEVVVDGSTTDFRLDDPLIAPFAQIITHVTGVEVIGSRTLGSSDARYFAAQNIPCVSFYPTGGGHHGPDEWLDKRAFSQMKEVIAQYLQQIAFTQI